MEHITTTIRGIEYKLGIGNWGWVLYRKKKTGCLYGRGWMKIPCYTRSEEERFPKGAAKWAQEKYDEFKKLNIEV